MLQITLQKYDDDAKRDYISIILRLRIRKQQAQNYPRCVPLQKTTLSRDRAAQKTSLATELPTELPSLILAENNFGGD